MSVRNAIQLHVGRIHSVGWAITTAPSDCTGRKQEPGVEVMNGSGYSEVEYKPSAFLEVKLQARSFFFF